MCVHEIKAKGGFCKELFQQRHFQRSCVSGSLHGSTPSEDRVDSILGYEVEKIVSAGSNIPETNVSLTNHPVVGVPACNHPILSQSVFSQTSSMEPAFANLDQSHYEHGDNDTKVCFEGSADDPPPSTLR